MTRRLPIGSKAPPRAPSTKSSLSTALATIDDALSKGDAALALLEAARAWRAWRDPRLGELSCVLGAQAARRVAWTRAPKDEKAPWRTLLANKERIHKTWLETAAKRDPLTLDALLEKLTASCPNRATSTRYGFAKHRFRTFIERIGALSKLDDDPRMTLPLVRVLKATPFTSADVSTGPAVYEPIIQLLERLGDARCLPELEALVRQPTTKSVNLRQYLAERLPAAVETIRSRVPLPAAGEGARLEALLARLGRPKARAGAASRNVAGAAEESLLQEVVAALGSESDDLGPWEVLADRYLELSDPRGELVSLQLAGERGGLSDAARAELHRLIRRDKEWLPPEIALATKNRAYHRGLLDSFDLLGRSATTEATFDKATMSSWLSTVRYCGQGAANEPLFLRFVTSAAMRSLSIVEVKSAHALEEVAATPTLAHRLKELRLAFAPSPSALKPLTEAQFPALRRLTIVPRSSYDRDALSESLARWRERPPIHELTLADWDGVDFLLAADRFEGIPEVSIETDWFEVGWDESNPRVALRGSSTKTRELDVRMSGDEEIVWSCVADVVKSRRIGRVYLRATEDGPVQLPRIASAVLDDLGARIVAMPKGWRRLS